MAVLRQHGTIVIVGVLEKEKDGTVWGQYFNGTTPAARKKSPATSGSWLDSKVVPSW